MEPIRSNNPNLQPPPQPFGINSNMQIPPQTQQQGFLMSPPPGFRPGMVMIPQPMMSQSNMNAPIQQQGQPQQPKIPLMANSTMGHSTFLSSNASRPNNNTRRETDPSPTTSPATTTTTSTTTTRKPFQELPLGIIQILNCKRNLLFKLYRFNNPAILYISVCRCRQTRI